MPTYNYVCPVCDKEFEKVHKIKDLDDVLFLCDCENEAELERQMSTPGVKVRGGTPKFH